MSTTFLRQRLFCFFTMVGTAAIGPLTPQADAINIIPIFNAGASDAPTFDAAGTGLTALFDYAEDYYQDVFEDAHTLTINFWYDDLSGGFIGQHSLIDEGPSCNNLVAPTPNCRELEANIRIDTRLSTGGAERNWFIDPTPATNNEFQMQQTLWRDITPGQRIDWYRFGANIPDTFEVAFSGSALNPSSTAGLGLDMLSTVLHEVGHALGMSSSNSSTVAETNDGDYDFNPDFVFNRTLAADVRDSASDSVGHIDNSLAGMNGFNLGTNGLRILPSHTDLFTMAAGHSYTNLDVPRREFYGGNAWQSDGNWSGDTRPGSADIAYVRHGGTVILSGLSRADTLFIDESSTVFTGANRLLATSAIAIQQTSGPGASFLSIPAGGEVEADLVFVNAAGRILITGGLVDANDVVVAVGGLITGNGTINVTDPIGELVNDGRITAVGGTLTFGSDNNIPFDLDGVLENGEVEAIDGNIVFLGGLSESFNGRATVGAGRTMSFNGGVGIGAGGLLLLDGTSASPATVTGNIAVLQNGVLRPGDRGIVSGPLRLDSGGAVTTSLSPSSRLSLNGFTNLAGGIMQGDGTIDQNGNAIVTQDTTISVATYNMDGTGNTTIDVSQRALTITSNTIESTPSDGFDGTLNINNGTVDIDAPWTLEGTVNFNDFASGTSELTGNGGVTLDGGTMNFNGGIAVVNTGVVVNNGTLFVDADATLMGPTTLGVNTSVNINDPQDSLHLRGNTVLVGPTIVGGGRLILEDDVNVAFVNTSIGTSETDLDGVTGNTNIRINSGITFSIASTTIEPTVNDGFDGTILNEGTFSVLAGWRLDGTLNMNPIGTNISTLSGFGPFEIYSMGTVNADDEVVINPDTTVAGTINVNSGRTQINGTANFSSTAVIEIAAGAELELNGATVFSGGSYTGDGEMQWDGAVTVDQSTTMNLGTVDMDGITGNTHTTINNAVLTLNVDRIDTAANRFDGTIDINATLSGLRVNLSDPNDSWQMDGTLNTSGGFLLAQTTLAGSDVRVTGTMNMDGIARIAAAMDLSGVMNLADAATEVQLSFGQHIIRNTATVAGPGLLRNLSNSSLLLANGASLDVNVRNDGQLQLGMSPGIASVSGNFTQVASGSLQVELAGELISEHDLLQVTDEADLAGELALSLIDGFFPELYDQISVLTAVGGINGFFETVSGVAVSPVHGLAVTYEANSVDVQAALLGDANLDGTVDGTDFLVWNDNKFACGKTWASGDFNGDGCANGPDFLLWNANKFTSADLAQAVPEPVGTLWLLLAVMAGFDRSARRRR